MKIDINKLKKLLVQVQEEHRMDEVSLEFGGYTLDENECTGVTLCLIVDDGLLFIQRSETMPSHKGHIAFIGGHKKDDETVIEAALREFEEETSLDMSKLEILGLTPPVYTSFNQQVIPVVAYYAQDKTTFIKEIKSNGEWDDAFIVPMKELANEANWRYAWRYSQFSNGPLLFLPVNGDIYLAKKNSKIQRLIWGATARMVWNFLRLTVKGL